jgi:hypothetical protein
MGATVFVLLGTEVKHQMSKWCARREFAIIVLVDLSGVLAYLIFGNDY